MAIRKNPQRSRRGSRKAIRSLRAAKAKQTEGLEQELGAAADIQANLLPSKIPQLPGYDIYTFYRSAKEVGGDYYDFIPIDHERLCVAIADVSGKGIPGAMIMACTRTLFRMLAPVCGTPAETFRQTNVQITRDIRRGMFVTAMLAFLNVHTCEMTVCSAGHNPMALYRSGSKQCELVNPPGIALGIDEGPVFNRVLQERQLKIQPGDRIMMFTDGVVEAMNAQDEQYGEDRLYQFLSGRPQLSSKELVRAVVHDLDEHKGKVDQYDDITIVTFRAYDRT